MPFESDSDNDDTRELSAAYATGDGSTASEQSTLVIALPTPVNGGTIAPTKPAAANAAKAPGDASAPIRAKAVARKPAQFGELSSDSDDDVGRAPARAPPSVVRHSAPLSAAATAAAAAAPAGDADSFSLDPRAFAAAVLRGQYFDPAVHTVQPVVHRRGAGGNRLYRSLDATEQREAEAYEREAVRREREAALKKQKAAGGEESAQPEAQAQIAQIGAISLKSPPSEAMRRPNSARLGEWCRPGFCLKVVDKKTTVATRAGKSMYKRIVVVVEAGAASAGADGGVRCAVGGSDDEQISLGGKTSVETVVGAPDDYGPDGTRRKAPAGAVRPHRLALVRVSPTASDKAGDTCVVVRLRACDVKSNRAVVAWRRCTREEADALSAGLGGVSGWEVTCVRLDDLCDEEPSAM